jgi:hypothetical protein
MAIENTYYDIFKGFFKNKNTFAVDATDRPRSNYYKQLELAKN